LSCRVYTCLADCLMLPCGLSYLAPWQEAATEAAKAAGRAATALLVEW
jgi:hypothetical protein